MKFRNSLALIGALAVALAVSACGSPTPNSPTPSARAEAFNTADVMFAQMMIPHHAGAIEMAQVILDKSDIDPRVVDLAERIQAAQGPEIDQLTAWLEESGYGDMGGMDGMDHGPSGGNIDGMMSEEDMADLEDAEGKPATRLFLEQMIMHHEGAIDMAEVELDNGSHDGTLNMAHSIVEAQQAEIAEMRDILSTF